LALRQFIRKREARLRARRLTSPARALGPQSYPAALARPAEAPVLDQAAHSASPEFPAEAPAHYSNPEASDLYPDSPASAPAAAAAEPALEEAVESSAFPAYSNPAVRPAAADPVPAALPHPPSQSAQ